MGMAKNLEDMTYEELIEHQKQAAQLIEKQRDEALKELSHKINEMIEQSPFDKTDVLNAMGVKASAPPKKSNVRAKYQHPKNPELTWTGRGRSAPAWVLEYLDLDKLDRQNPDHMKKLAALEVADK
jgi:DNA-binding protein H-NS